MHTANLLVRRGRLITALASVLCSTYVFSVGAWSIRPHSATAAARAVAAPIHSLIPRGVVGAPTGSARTSGTPSSATSSLGTRQVFSGLPDDGAAKSDATVAAGPNDIIEMINSKWAAYSKTGAQQYQTTLASWYGVQGNGFDVRVVYDVLSGHYVMINLRYASSTASYVELSASTTSSATGAWCKYEIPVQDGTNQPDFPGLGFDGQALYLSMDMYPVGSSMFQYAKVLVLNEAQLVQCVTPVSTYTFSHLQNADGTMAEAVQPARTLDAEPAEYMANAAHSGLAHASSAITVWTLTSPLNNPTLTAATITVNEYSTGPSAPQGGTTYYVDTFTKALIQVTVRGGMLWTAHTVNLTANSQHYAVDQWLELNPAGLSVAQQGKYYLTGSYAYIPAITVTSDGSAFMVFSVSNSTTYVGVRYAARKATDTAGRLPTGGLIQAGLGPWVYTTKLVTQPWGDAFSAAVDPSDQTKVWLCAEYASTNNQWGTVIAELGF